MPSQVVSPTAPAPATQLSSSTPPTQLEMPELAHAPMPQLVVTGWYSSSTVPSQSLSWPSQLVSTVSSGDPCTQLSSRTPFTQLELPELAHTPKPQLVGAPTKS